MKKEKTPCENQKTCLPTRSCGNLVMWVTNEHNWHFSFSLGSPLCLYGTKLVMAASYLGQSVLFDTVLNVSPLQMTPCQPAVTWTWRTGSPTWSRSCSFRKMRSSCWNQLWLMPCVGWATARSRPRGCTQEGLGGGLWPPRLQPSRPKVTETPAARPCTPLMSHRYFCRAESVSQLDPGSRIIDLSTAATVIIWLSVRQLLQALPSRPVSNGYVQQKRLLSSPSSPRKETAQSIKRWEVHNMTLKLENAADSLPNSRFSIGVLHFCLCVSDVSFRKSMSTERLTLVRREMGAESRSRTTSSSSSSGGKR